ncbi:hypothetical protein H0A66_02660 [Alcaligenaceae bacterium]|nr:hypothetical protein [Alcaligenaceae bacterium]
MLVSASASYSRASAELAALKQRPPTPPRLPFVSTRRTPTAALSYTHPRQLRNRKLAGLTALQPEKLVLLALLVSEE